MFYTQIALSYTFDISGCMTFRCRTFQDENNIHQAPPRAVSRPTCGLNMGHGPSQQYRFLSGDSHHAKYFWVVSL